MDLWNSFKSVCEILRTDKRVPPNIKHFITLLKSAMCFGHYWLSFGIDTLNLKLKIKYICVQFVIFQKLCKSLTLHLKTKEECKLSFQTQIYL